jgi:hypothetical protein
MASSTTLAGAIKTIIVADLVMSLDNVLAVAGAAKDSWTLIIFGLVVYDVTRTTLTVWVWVIIQAIIATSILLGTRYAAAARLAKPKPPKPRNFAAAAINLNLVLSIVFGVVVAIMSFSYGVSAVNELATYPNWNAQQTEVFYRTPEPITVDWLVQDLAPALVLLLLAQLGVYRMILIRHTAKTAE